MRYPTAGGGLEFVRLAFVGHSRPRLSIPGGLSDQVRDGPALYPATQFEVLPRVRGTSGELLNQCTRVQHPPMLDHLAVFDAELVGDPKVGCEVGCCHDGQPFELFDEHQPSVVAPRALAWLSPLHMEANEVTFQEGLRPRRLARHLPFLHRDRRRWGDLRVPRATRLRAGTTVLGAAASRRAIVGCDGGCVVGTAVMGPNRPGRGSHIATASFMVDPAHHGKGTGRALGNEMVGWARRQGYHGVQFNAVVETNAPAVHLWQSLGFRVLGTVPEAFNHRRHGLVGLHVMYLPLTGAP